MRRWKKSFNALPDEIKRRVVLENDEFSYSIDDVLMLSSMVEKNSGSATTGYNIPVVFDIFHYACYQDTAEKQNIPAQSSIENALKAVALSWRNDRIPKMHVSQQRPNASKGAHSDYITELPDYILNYPKKFKRSLDVMIEAKCKEKAVMELYKKYPQLRNGKK
jgi:UV DNA damage endonuclease